MFRHYYIAVVTFYHPLSTADLIIIESRCIIVHMVGGRVNGSSSCLYLDESDRNGDDDDAYLQFLFDTL